jgi:hypothetical protein
MQFVEVFCIDVFFCSPLVSEEEAEAEAEEDDLVRF